MDCVKAAKALLMCLEVFVMHERWVCKSFSNFSVVDNTDLVFAQQFVFSFRASLHLFIYLFLIPRKSKVRKPRTVTRVDYFH